VHALLVRQLRKAFGDVPDDPRLARLLAMIDDAYVAADDERVQLERSLFLASDELSERNRRLEHELAERKRLELELQHAEKLRAVGQLAAGVAHEINTPIQFIGDSLTFLTDSLADLGISSAAAGVARVDADEVAFLRLEVPRAVRRCQDGAKRVGAIVRALKGLAHPGGAVQEPADLHATIDNTLLIVASEVKYVADVELAFAATRLVRCHVGEIQQVFLNLIVNAAHAIGERVGCSGQRGTVRIATRDDGADVVVTISDDGAGIPTELRSRIFEPFFTTKPVGQGTGQGLSIARSLIVDHHGGQIELESTVGVGTAFTVRLPVDGRVEVVAPAA
jgi:signal transduction histidine kinase